MSLIKTEPIVPKDLSVPIQRLQLSVNQDQVNKDLDKTTSVQVATAVAKDDASDAKKKPVAVVDEKELKVDTSSQLITKYRPDDFNQVYGNEFAVKALEEAVKSASRHHAYFFFGPTGVGKTTLARIIAKKVDAEIFEINAALNSGVDAMRDLADATRFKPVLAKSAMLIIVDECHNLSQKAWEPFLKLIEEAPSYLYLAFCSTEPQNIPETITKGRTYIVNLKPVRTQDMESFVALHAQLEGWTLTNDVFNGIVLASEGSPRHALSILQAGHTAQTIEELSQVVVGIQSEDSPSMKLCQYLVRGGKNWPMVSRLLQKIDNPEEAITHVCNYFTAVMARSEEAQAKDAWKVIQCLSENRAIFNKRLQLYAGIGKLLWGAEPL